ELLGSAWAQLSLLAAGVAWGRALWEGRGGVLSSAALAAALVLGLLATWGASLWVDVALAHATAERGPFSLGLWRTAPLVGGRWAAAAGVAVILNVGGGMLEFGLSLPLSLLSGGMERGMSGLLLGQVGSGFAAAVAWSLLDHARAQALLALQLDIPAPTRSASPPPVAYVVPVAEVIKVAERVPPVGPDGEGGA
ncbi:MAG: hypothetical protein FJ086_20615, partial [Deltaproteobacteria bacterium]|nr:hypothetical protein [Deltaproteobacteria bacterium]